MSVPVHNYVWGQGEDLVLTIVYKAGPAGAEVPVDLTGYSLRMDIVGDTRLYTFNSDDIADPAVDEVGPLDNEAVLGADGTINITVPRALTLPGGTVHNALAAGNNIFKYDIFLRDTTGKQKKILRGQITVEESHTLWE